MMNNNAQTEYGHHHEHSHNSHHHDHSGHVTPEILEQLKDTSDAAKQAKIDKIIAHISEPENDPDLKYKKGLGHFYLDEFEECMREQAEAYPFFNDEMGIAAIYWHTVAAWKCGAEPVLLKEKYNGHMDVGHHTAYNKAMAVASGLLSEKNAEMMLSFEHRPLEYSIFAYGYACWLESTSRKDEAEEYYKKVIDDDRFWVTYSYLAAWNKRDEYK